MSHTQMPVDKKDDTPLFAVLSSVSDQQKKEFLGSVFATLLELNKPLKFDGKENAFQGQDKVQALHSRFYTNYHVNKQRFIRSNFDGIHFSTSTLGQPRDYRAQDHSTWEFPVITGVDFSKPEQLQKLCQSIEQYAKDGISKQEQGTGLPMDKLEELRKKINNFKLSQKQATVTQEVKAEPKAFDKASLDKKDEFQTVLIPIYFPLTRLGAVAPDYDFKHGSDLAGSYMGNLIMVNPQRLKEGDYNSIADILTEHLKHRHRLVGIDDHSVDRVGHYRSWYKASDGRMHIIAKVKKSDLAQTSDADGRLENVTCLKQGTIISLENIIGFGKSERGEIFIKDFPEKGNNPAFAKAERKTAESPISFTAAFDKASPADKKALVTQFFAGILGQPFESKTTSADMISLTATDRVVTRVIKAGNQTEETANYKEFKNALATIGAGAFQLKLGSPRFQKEDKSYTADLNVPEININAPGLGARLEAYAKEHPALQPLITKFGAAKVEAKAPAAAVTEQQRAEMEYAAKSKSRYIARQAVQENKASPIPNLSALAQPVTDHKALSTEQKQVIVNLLNAMHDPMGQKNWKVIRGFIAYEGPPLKYSRKGGPQGGDIKNKLYDPQQFSPEAKAYGFSDEFIKTFLSNLKIEDHKAACYYELQLTDLAFLNTLLKNAVKYISDQPTLQRAPVDAQAQAEREYAEKSRSRYIASPAAQENAAEQPAMPKPSDREMPGIVVATLNSIDPRMGIWEVRGGNVVFPGFPEDAEQFLQKHFPKVKFNVDEKQSIVTLDKSAFDAIVDYSLRLGSPALETKEVKISQAAEAKAPTTSAATTANLPDNALRAKAEEYKENAGHYHNAYYDKQIDHYIGALLPDAKLGEPLRTDTIVRYIVSAEQVENLRKNLPGIQSITPDQTQGATKSFRVDVDKVKFLQFIIDKVKQVFDTMSAGQDHKVDSERSFRFSNANNRGGIFFTSDNPGFAKEFLDKLKNEFGMKTTSPTHIRRGATSCYINVDDVNKFMQAIAKLPAKTAEQAPLSEQKRAEMEYAAKSKSRYIARSAMQENAAVQPALDTKFTPPPRATTPKAAEQPAMPKPSDREMPDIVVATLNSIDPRMGIWEVSGGNVVFPGFPEDAEQFLQKHFPKVKFNVDEKQSTVTLDKSAFDAIVDYSLRLGAPALETKEVKVGQAPTGDSAVPFCKNLSDFIKNTNPPFKQEYEQILRAYQGKVKFDVAQENIGNYRLPLEMLLDIAAVYQKQYDVHDLGGRQNIFYNYKYLVDRIFTTVKYYTPSRQVMDSLPQAKKDILVTLTTPNHNYSLLMTLATTKNVDAVKFCLEQKACNPKHLASRGENALTVNSGMSGKEAAEIQQRLLAAGCAELINLRNMAGYPLLSLCYGLASYIDMEKGKDLPVQEARIRALLDAKADVNATDEYDKNKITALMWVCMKNDVDLAKELVTKYKADVMAVDATGMTAMDHATDENLKRFLFNAMASIRAAQETVEDRMVPARPKAEVEAPALGKEAAKAAAYSKLSDFIDNSDSPFREKYEQILRDYKANFDVAKTEFGSPQNKLPIEMLLDVARVFQQQHDVSKVSGALFYTYYDHVVKNIFSKCLNAPIRELQALSQPKRDFLMQLTQRRDNQTLLFEAVSDSKQNLVKFCLEQKADVNHVANRQLNILQENSKFPNKENAEIQTLLLAAGAGGFINKQVDGMLPIFSLCYKLDTKLWSVDLPTQQARILELLEAKADLNVHETVHDQRTPLMLACRYNNVDLAQQFVTKYKADVMAVDAHGRTALDYATDEKLKIFLQQAMAMGPAVPPRAKAKVESKDDRMGDFVPMPPDFEGELRAEQERCLMAVQSTMRYTNTRSSISGSGVDLIISEYVSEVIRNLREAIKMHSDGKATPDGINKLLDNIKDLPTRISESKNTNMPALPHGAVMNLEAKIESQISKVKNVLEMKGPTSPGTGNKGGR